MSLKSVPSPRNATGGGKTGFWPPGDLQHFTGLNTSGPFGEVGLEIPERHLTCDHFWHGRSAKCDDLRSLEPLCISQ